MSNQTQTEITYLPWVRRPHDVAQDGRMQRLLEPHNHDRHHEHERNPDLPVGKETEADGVQGDGDDASRGR